MTDAADAAPTRLHEVYSAELRVHAVTLIWLGYGRLKTDELCMAEEDDITGELVREMRLVAQDPSSPAWVDRYEIHEQGPQNVAGKFGKWRPKMDIEVERHHRGPRPRLGFEAKRLGRGTTIRGYLGGDGLAAFFSGHYPTTHGEAGMLGYVQEDSTDSWSGKLHKALSQKPDEHRVCAGGELKPGSTNSAAPFFCSGHSDMQTNPLLVVHVLLAFTP